jgi:hypothetical protein
MPNRNQNRRRLQKPKGIFLIAEQFLAVARLPIRLQNVDHSILSPYTSYEVKALIQSPEIAYMACAAFALELYFKCLIRYGRKSFDGLHDLSKLFNLIGKHHRVKIKKCWDAHSQQVKGDLCQRYIQGGRTVPHIDFDFVLSLSRDAFVTMRYAYEGIPPNAGWAGDAIIDCTRQRILELHPEWEARSARLD